MDLARESFYTWGEILFTIEVSILVLVDLAREYTFGSQILQVCEQVSILVLVDLARELPRVLLPVITLFCFNPCFSGSCSRICFDESEPEWCP